MVYHVFRKHGIELGNFPNRLTFGEDTRKSNSRLTADKGDRDLPRPVQECTIDTEAQRNNILLVNDIL
jgi:hypothetical protein